MLKKLCFVFAGALSSASPAMAQDGGQRVVDTYFARWNEGDGLKLLDHLARCVADRHPQAADAFVLENENAYAFQSDQARLVDTSCIKKYWFRSSSTTIDQDMYRPMLAEGLLSMMGPEVAATPFVATSVALTRPHLPDVPINQVHPYYRDMFHLSHAWTNLARYSECVARTQPDAVRKLVSIPRNSPEEQAAIAEIDQSVTECAAERPTLSFPSYVRRGDLMLQLYALNRATGGPVPKAKK